MRNRMRAQGVVALGILAHVAYVTAVFALTGAFSASALVVSGFVSVILLAASVAIAFTSRSPSPVLAQEKRAGRHDVVYRTRVGAVVRGDREERGGRVTDYHAITRRGIVSIADIEAAVDRAELPASPLRDRDVEAALDRHAARAVDGEGPRTPRPVRAPDAIAPRPLDTSAPSPN